MLLLLTALNATLEPPTPPPPPSAADLEQLRQEDAEHEQELTANRQKKAHASS